MSDDIELLPGQADVLDLLTGVVTIVVPAPYMRPVRKRKTGS